MEDLLNRSIDMYSVLHTVCASCDIVVCIHQVHGKNYCEFLKGMLLLFFRSLIWLEHEYKILLWLHGQYFKGWRFKHLRDNKIKNSNKAQRFSSEFVYLFHCVIYTRVQCSYVSRTDFLDKQILIVVTVELEANMAAFHSVPVELVFSCWNLHLLADFYVTQESFHTTHLVHWTLVYHTRLVSST